MARTNLESLSWIKNVAAQQAVGIARRVKVGVVVVSVVDGYVVREEKRRTEHEETQGHSGALISLPHTTKVGKTIEASRVAGRKMCKHG